MYAGLRRAGLPGRHAHPPARGALGAVETGRSVERTERDLKALLPERDWDRLHLQIILFGREHCPRAAARLRALPDLLVGRRQGAASERAPHGHRDRPRERPGARELAARPALERARPLSEGPRPYLLGRRVEDQLRRRLEHPPAPALQPAPQIAVAQHRRAAEEPQARTRPVGELLQELRQLAPEAQPRAAQPVVHAENLVAVRGAAPADARPEEATARRAAGAAQREVEREPALERAVREQQHARGRAARQQPRDLREGLVRRVQGLGRTRGARGGYGLSSFARPAPLPWPRGGRGAVADMDEREYRRRADECLEGVADWLEGFDPDEVDYSTADGVVTIEFPDGARYVLNRQAGAHQMWFAAGARAWHYDWDVARGAWVDDRDGHALAERIGGSLSEKLGRSVALPA